MAISVMFRYLGIPSEQRVDLVWIFNRVNMVGSDESVSYIEEINNLYEVMIAAHPVSEEYIEEYKKTLTSVTVDLFGVGKLSKAVKLSKKSFAELVNTHCWTNFAKLLFSFLKAAESEVINPYFFIFKVNLFYFF
jgi:hypothetical protein